MFTYIELFCVVSNGVAVSSEVAYLPSQLAHLSSEIAYCPVKWIIGTGKTFKEPLPFPLLFSL